MSRQRFTPEFKEEAVKQGAERGYGVPEVAARFAPNHLQREFTVDTANKVW